MNINSNFNSVIQVQNEYLQNNSRSGKVESGKQLDFKEILLKQSVSYETEDSVGIENGLKFSKHASNRLLDRNIDLTQNQVQRLEDGAKVARQKGIKESLVLVDELAFIVNVPSSTVVTAMDKTGNTENVFTNIDGAVVM